MHTQTHIIRHFLILALLLAGSVVMSAAPRVMPKEQAERFCRLLVNDGKGSIYPLSLYAEHLTTMLCGETRYGDYTAEQVFSGLVFFYDDWLGEPLLYGNAQGQMLVEELHSGRTLRVFPHLSANGQAAWYAPTDSIPETVGTEHRKYMHEVFARLNGEVQAGNWEYADQYIDRMIQYQCQYGGNGRKVSLTSPYLIVLIALFLALPLVISVRHKHHKRCTN